MIYLREVPRVDQTPSDTEPNSTATGNLYEQQLMPHDHFICAYGDADSYVCMGPRNSVGSFGCA